MELVSPLNVLFDELRSGLHFNPHPAERQASGALSRGSIHGKIVDAESSRVQLFAEVISQWRNIFN
jgi:hypothetical protein